MPDLIRVLHITTGLETGGAEIMLYRLLERIDSRFASSVVSLTSAGSYGDRIADLGIDVQILGMKRGVPTPGALLRLREIVRQEQPDVLCGWMYHGNLAAIAVRALTAPERPVVWTVHNAIDKREKFLTRLAIAAGARLSPACQHAIFFSYQNYQAHEAIGYRAAATSVVPNGFDTAQFVPSAAARASVRAELQLPPDTPLIGLLARFHPMKDHATFLQAAALLARAQPEVHFLLAGTEVTAETPELAEWMRSRDLKGRVHLLGVREDVPRLMAALDIGGLSSAYGEACPTVVGEAMACGVPCVVTDTGDSGLLVGETGRVVPPQDAAALARAWAELLALGREGRAQLGAAARSRIEQHYPIARIVRGYEDVFDSVVARRSGESSGKSERGEHGEGNAIR